MNTENNKNQVNKTVGKEAAIKCFVLFRHEKNKGTSRPEIVKALTAKLKEVVDNAD